MTGGSPGSGPPADAEVDAGWDALLGDAPSAPASAPVLPAALLPPPVISPSTPGPATQPPPADLLALTDEAPVPSPAAPLLAAAPPGLPTPSASAAAVGDTTPPQPLEPSPAASDSSVRAESAESAERTERAESAERAERAVAASGHLGAAVVEDDELGAARSGRRVRVTPRVSQRADEPAATSGSINIAELDEDAAEPREHPPSRPKVAVRAAATTAPRAPSVSPSGDGGPTGTGGWGWIGIVVIGAVIVGGLFFVQASMRGREEPSGPNASRSPSGAKGSAAKKSPKTAAARDVRDARDGSDTSEKASSSGAAASSGKGPAPELEEGVEDAGEGVSGDAQGDPLGDAPPTAIDALPPGAEPPPAENPPDEAGAAVQPAAHSASGARPRDADPRAVPDGTSPEAAAAFKKIGVSAGDGPPIGAIGASGIHVDDITIGDEWASSRCAGETSKFSIAADKPVNVCLRIVHHREEEQLGVAWQQNGRTVRRSKIKVPDLHAYRTRAYLALRKEYVGQWTVRITSADGAELASVSFAVVE